MLSVSTVKLDASLQPRNIRLAPFRDQTKLTTASVAHVALLTAYLSTGRAVELEPVLVAQVGRTLYLVDGHHRMRAYRAETRRFIPARVLTTDFLTAVQLSKLVNLDGAKLALHPEQRREAAWQFMGYQTEQGRRAMPEGSTCVNIGGRFGFSHDTAWRMMRRVETVKASDYPMEARDPGTGWPLWKHVKGNAFRDAYAEVDASVKLRRAAEKLAVVIAKAPPEVYRLAVELLREDAMLHPDEQAADQTFAEF